jgi:nitroreductase
MSKEPLASAALDQLFREARTYGGWRGEPITGAALKSLYELAKLGPTAGNTSPARFVFVTSPAGKQRLSPHLSAGNRDKTMAAPVTVIVGYDLDFAKKVPFLFPHKPEAANWYGDPVVAQETALRSSSLQGAYLIMAARALGYDCGPMSGFDNDGVDKEFFSGARIRSNFLINIGKGDPLSLRPRLPRLSFEEVCSVI